MALVNVEDVQRREWLAIEFERHRAHLRAVGYRMLGSMTEAEDAVQEAWIRLQRHDPGGTDDLRGWLTVTVGRICLDVLRSRRSRRETYAGSWLPEPIVTWPDADGRVEPSPERDVVQAESIGIALLVVLDTLAPPERLAFVLHDVFGVGFDQIAEIVDRTPAAARQLASRARRRVRAAAPDPQADVAVQRTAIDAFVAAARAGDFEALLRVLDPDVVFTIDGGGRGPFARPPIRGAATIAGQASRMGPRFAAFARPALVNRQAGLVIEGTPGAPRIIASFVLRAGLISAIHMNADPLKTRRVPAPDG